MQKYTVNDGEKQYNGKAYQPGETIECTVEEARQMRLVAQKQEEHGEEGTTDESAPPAKEKSKKKK